MIDATLHLRVAVSAFDT